MQADIDPKLLAQLEAAGDDAEIEAVILLADAKGAGAVADPRGTGGPVVDRVCAALQQQPIATQFMPNLGAVCIRGVPSLIHALLAQDEIISATVNDATITKG